MKTFLVISDETPQNFHSLSILHHTNLSADNSSNVARKEHNINKDKQRIIQTAFNYELSHLDEMEKFQDLNSAPRTVSTFSIQQSLLRGQ